MLLMIFNESENRTRRGVNWHGEGKFSRSSVLNQPSFSLLVTASIILPVSKSDSLKFWSFNKLSNLMYSDPCWLCDKLYTFVKNRKLTKPCYFQGSANSNQCFLAPRDRLGDSSELTNPLSHFCGKYQLGLRRYFSNFLPRSYASVPLDRTSTITQG